MRKKWSPYVWNLLWVVGLIALLLISNELGLKIRYHVATTFHMLPITWYYAFAAFVIGVYISLLFINVRAVKWNWPLIICVTVPCFIIAFYYPVTYTIVQTTASDPGNFSVPIPIWLMNINFVGILGIPSLVAGLTLMVGMFEHYGNQK
ncbi:hypothetical protein PB01_15980 [Psychrobacillus glaciei]|uniref:Uncharacterized protein n=1 Tax=Psychrobacillus glaciei TaxID=2283160 RepID=A0A5J6SRC4_9BACI|nr:hypothetical protein [Psychrobacillus glaciei]QFG00190.1 hypothetical protein PB01_15980 [Psychrobacillus glaciei]